MKNLTELIFILDKSGSMSGLERDTIGGFNSLIQKQKNEEGKCLVTTCLFSDNTEVIHDRIDLNDVKELTTKEYYVSGCTALLDCIGLTLSRIAKIHLKMDKEDLPNKTMVIITTDGQENASREYSYSQIKKLIEERKKNDWEFIFLGANIDTVKEASKFGIDKDNAINYNCDSTGVSINYESLECAISEVRKSGKMSKTWRRKIDEDFKSRNS